MSKMYYAENPDAAHDIHELRVGLLGEKMTFLTDAGVFSKKMVDFGSQLLLKCLEVNQGETVLDVGCGYGPLGLSLAKAYGVQATMVDINNRALDLARQNAERNKVEATIFQSNICPLHFGKPLCKRLLPLFLNFWPRCLWLGCTN